MDAALIAAHAENPALAPYLHLPVQSGSDRILSAMNRRHDAAAYLDIIARVRRARPDIAFSSDFIVGFPGETDADFEATLALAREVGFASGFAFKYSPRPGTPAADAPDQVPAGIMERRLARLLALLEQQRHAFNRATVGKRFGVIFDRPGRHEGQRVGRSPYMQGVHADCPPEAAGRMRQVEIVEVGPNSLRGRLV
jgi:tRNA-2-methylthio-N6-dimethylallyladenosine synthase